jgi:hypothetical protein
LLREQIKSSILCRATYINEIGWGIAAIMLFPRLAQKLREYGGFTAKYAKVAGKWRAGKTTNLKPDGI